MKRGVVALATAALLAGTIAVAAAQGPGGGGGFGGGQGRRGGMMGGRNQGGMQLLGVPAVQVELKMTPAQIAKLEPAQETLRTTMREMFQGMQQGERPTPEEMQKRMAKLREMQSKAVAGILNADQVKRFKQLEIQRAGANALMLPEVATALRMTDAQKAKVTEIQTKQREEMMQMFQNGGGAQMDPQQMAARQKANSDAILAVLSPSQAKALKEMGGAPFKFPAPQRRGGFGGPGGGGPGGPGGPGGGPGGPGGN